MNKSIKNYEDLLHEQARLKTSLYAQGDQIKFDLEEIKKEIRPVISVLSFIGKLSTRETRNNILLDAGASMSIDWLSKKLLSKSFIASFLLPPVLKNVSSKLLYKLGNAFVK